MCKNLSPCQFWFRYALCTCVDVPDLYTCFFKTLNSTNETTNRIKNYPKQLFEIDSESEFQLDNVLDKTTNYETEKMD